MAERRTWCATDQQRRAIESWLPVNTLTAIQDACVGVGIPADGWPLLRWLRELALVRAVAARCAHLQRHSQRPSGELLTDREICAIVGREFGLSAHTVRTRKNRVAATVRCARKKIQNETRSLGSAAREVAFSTIT